MIKVKCSYCGKNYSVKEVTDLCPFCNGHNDLSVEQYERLQKMKEKDNKNKGSHSLKKILLGILILPAIFIIILFCIAFSVGFIKGLFGIEDDEEYNSLNSSTSISSTIGNMANDVIKLSNGEIILVGSSNITWDDIDYDKFYTVYGSFDDFYPILDKINEHQFSGLHADINLSGKIATNGTTIYFDGLNLGWYGGNNLYIRLSVESLGNGVKPSSTELYLIDTDNNRYRLFSEYNFTYEEGIDDFIDLFEYEFVGDGDLNANISDYKKFKTFEVVVDDEIFSFDLKYSDNLEFEYYGLK